MKVDSCQCVINASMALEAQAWYDAEHMNSDRAELDEQHGIPTGSARQDERD